MEETKQMPFRTLKAESSEDDFDLDDCIDCLDISSQEQETVQPQDRKPWLMPQRNV